MEDDSEGEGRDGEEGGRREEEERKKREEAEAQMEGMQKEMEEMKKKEGGLHAPASSVITSLYGTSVTFSQSEWTRREGNTITHHGNFGLSGKYLNCFIGGVMTSGFYFLFLYPVIFIPKHLRCPNETRFD